MHGQCLLVRLKVYEEGFTASLVVRLIGLLLGCLSLPARKPVSAGMSQAFQGRVSCQPGCWTDW